MSARCRIPLVAAALALAISAGTASGGTTHGQVAGWILFVGGPSRSIQARRLDGKVVVRNASGDVVRRIRATKRQGFAVALSPGRYELSPIVIGTEGRRLEACPVETKVTVRAGKNTGPVNLGVDCRVP